MSEHSPEPDETSLSPEPWHTDEDEGLKKVQGTYAFRIFDARGYLCGVSWQSENIRRICACVNFCARIPTETIERLLEQKIGAATALKRQLVYCPSCGDAYDHEADDCLAKPLAEAAKEIE